MGPQRNIFREVPAHVFTDNWDELRLPPRDYKPHLQRVQGVWYSVESCSLLAGDRPMISRFDSFEQASKVLRMDWSHAREQMRRCYP